MEDDRRPTTDKFRGEVTGAHLTWACYQCAVPDLSVVYWLNEAPRLRITCSVNHFAPHAASHNCKSFRQDPGLRELLE